MTTAVVYVVRSCYGFSEMTTKQDRQAIKIPRRSYERLRSLAAYAARNGWASLGIERDDPPTQTALIEEAIGLLEKRQTKRGAR